jgi:hypothetical protein
MFFVSFWGCAREEGRRKEEAFALRGEEEDMMKTEQRYCFAMNHY